MTFTLRNDGFTSEVSRLLQEVMNDEHGTISNEIANVIKESNDAAENCKSVLWLKFKHLLFWYLPATSDFMLSHCCAISQCEPALYATLLQYLHKCNLDIRGITKLSKGPAMPILPLHTRFYSFVFLKHCQYSTTCLTKAHSLGMSLICACFNNYDGSTWTLLSLNTRAIAWPWLIWGGLHLGMGNYWTIGVHSMFF